jgi:O-acetyl-ADP-ribose deacetylase (regulator of RNase III)
MYDSVRGNILDIQTGIILNGVNCKNSFGSGLAGQIAKRWPNAKQAYHDYYIENTRTEMHRTLTDKEICLLGKFTFVQVEPGKTIAHCFTQLEFGYDGNVYASIDAIGISVRGVMRKILQHRMNHPDVKMPVYFPKLGCGLGGLDWHDVSDLMYQISEEYPTIEMTHMYL